MLRLAVINTRYELLWVLGVMGSFLLIPPLTSHAREILPQFVLFCSQPLSSPPVSIQGPVCEFTKIADYMSMTVGKFDGGAVRAPA